MRNIYNLFPGLTILLVIAAGLKTAAQPVSMEFQCSQELSRIKMLLQDTACVSFHTQYVITYNDGTSNTVNYEYKLSKNRMHCTAGDNTELIQNYAYNLLLDHKRHRAVVSRPVDIFTYLANVNITDLTFYKLLVTGRTLSATGKDRRLSYHFKPASPYRSYDIVYDPVTYRIRSIEYNFNISGSQSGSSGSKMPFHVTISFSNYQTGRFSDSVFATTGYFTRKQGIYSLVAPYTHYQLINSLPR